MTDEYLSSAGHWERINVSASAIIGDPQKLNLPVIVQDLCRALLDLHEALTVKPCETCARHDAYAANEAKQREAQYFTQTRLHPPPEVTLGDFEFLKKSADRKREES